MKKRIYIAGAGGMLGEAFYAQFKDDYEIKCTDKDVNEDWLTFLDFRDFQAYKKEVEEFASEFADLLLCAQESSLHSTFLLLSSRWQSRHKVFLNLAWL